jgi:hypothetical protein
MEHLGSIVGSGELYERNELLGPAKYRIDIWRQPGPGKMREANGLIEADRQILLRAFDAVETTLVLEDGKKVTVLVVGIEGFMPDQASIAISGPVPGF